MTSKEFLHKELDSIKEQYAKIKARRKIYSFIAGILIIALIVCFVFTITTSLWESGSSDDFLKTTKIIVFLHGLLIVIFAAVVVILLMLYFTVFRKGNNNFKNVELFSNHDMQLELYKIRFNELINNESKQLTNFSKYHNLQSKALFEYGVFSVRYDANIKKEVRRVSEKRTEIVYIVNLSVAGSIQDADRGKSICSLRRNQAIHKLFAKKQSSSYESESMEFNKNYIVQGNDNFSITKLFTPKIIDLYNQKIGKFPQGIWCSFAERGFQITSSYETRIMPNCCFGLGFNKLGKTFDEWIESIITYMDKQFSFFFKMIDTISPFEIEKKTELLK